MKTFIYKRLIVSLFDSIAIDSVTTPDLSEIDPRGASPVQLTSVAISVRGGVFRNIINRDGINSNLNAC